MSELWPTDFIHGKIVRISNTGNGVLDYGGGEISIGPVYDDAVGEEVDAVVYDRDHALCLDASVRTEEYDNVMKAQTGQLLNNPPADCPGLGDTIDVEIEGVNSSGHGNATHFGLPVRVRNIPQEISVGDVASVKVYRLEPTRIIATGQSDIRLRSQLPGVGERFTATITHRTHSGNGLIESFVDHDINLGPVQPDGPGTTVDAILLDSDWAYCLTNSVVTDGYDDAMRVHIPGNFPFRLEELSNRRQTDDNERSGRIGRIIRGDSKRRRSFRDHIVQAYDGACAVCGQRLQDARSGTYFEIEAAHIFPVSGVEVDDAAEGGPDTIQNGLALCRTHHWAFDNGWFTISNDYVINISGDASKSGYDDLQQYDGEELLLPDDESLWPAPYYLQAHREKV